MAAGARDIHNDIPTPREARFSATSVFLGLSVLLCAWIFYPLWKPLLLGTVFAATVYGLHERLAVRLRQRRYLSAGLFTVGTALLILAPLAGLGAVAARQAAAVVNSVQKAIATGELRELLRPLPDRLEHWLVPLLPTNMGRTGGSAEAGRWAALQVQSALQILSEFAFDLAMMMIAFFFVLTDGRRLGGWLTSVSPLGRGRTEELLAEFRLVSRSVIGSNLVTGLAQAAVATVGYLVAGAPQPLFFGLLTLLASFIPSVGTGLVSLPLSLLLFLLGRPWAGLFLALWSLLVVGLVDNILRPWLIKNGVQIHGALIFFSLIGGILLFGLPGLVVGPMALTFFTTMMRFYGRDRRVAARLAAARTPEPEAFDQTQQSRR